MPEPSWWRCWWRFAPCCWPRSIPSWRRSAGSRCDWSGLGFLLILALVTAESTQAVGALLLLKLLAAPAGAAHKLTASPYRGVALSALLATVAMWGGLALSYAIGAPPPSSAVIGLAAGEYALASILARRR